MVGLGAMDLMALLHLPLPFPALDAAASDRTEDGSQSEEIVEDEGHFSRFIHPVTIDDWRRMAHQLVEFIAEYYTKLLAQPSSIRVQPPPTLSPGFLRSKLPNTAPDGPESFEAVLRDIEDLILPGLLHWQHPNFYGYFSHSHSFPGILADLLSSAFGTLGFQWTSSPSMTELEITVLDWLVHLLRLPSFYNSSAKDGAGAALQSSASEAVLISMVAARARSLSDLSAEDSIRLVAYCSDQAHSCVQKAAMVAGIINVRVLPTQPEEEYALNPSLLGTAIQKDLQDGLIPFWAASTIGTTSSCAVDPVSDLADVCGQSRVWLHVDAAYAGSFAAIPEIHSKYFGGIEKADSYDMNPHKGLLTGWDCSTLFVKQSRWVQKALALTPEYLKDESSKQAKAEDSVTMDVPQYKDWEVPLGTHFRALKLWFVLRLYGAEKLREFQRHRLMLQDLVVSCVARDARFEFVRGAPPRFGLVCFRVARATESQHAAILQVINESGRAFMVHTKLSGRYVLRFAVGGTYSQPVHVLETWSVVQDAVRRVLGETLN